MKSSSYCSYLSTVLFFIVSFPSIFAHAAWIPEPDPSDDYFEISKVIGNKDTYKTKSQIKLKVAGVDKISGKSLSAKQGYNVQSYIYPRSGKFVDDNYLRPNPENSYNATFSKKNWEVKMKAPTSPGEYTLISTLYCSDTNAECNVKNFDRDNESKYIMNFTVTGSKQKNSKSNILQNQGIIIKYPEVDSYYKIGNPVYVFWEARDLTQKSGPLWAYLYKHGKGNVLGKQLNQVIFNGSGAGDFDFSTVGIYETGEYMIVLCTEDQNLCASGNNFFLTR